MTKAVQYTFLMLASVLFMVSVGYHANLGTLTQDFDQKDLLMHFNVKNTGSKKIYDGRINLWIPDLDLYVNTHEFTLRAGTIYSGIFFPSL